MLPLNSFPKSFQEEVEAFCQYLRAPDPLDPHAPLRAYRSATIKGYVLTFRRLGSEFVRTGSIAQGEVSGLAVLCTPEHLKAALRPYLPEGAGRTFEYPHKMAVHITFVARQYLRMSEEAVAPIRLITSRLGENLPLGMGKRNKSRLAPFDDPAVVRRLLAFPAAERDRTSRTIRERTLQTSSRIRWSVSASGRARRNAPRFFTAQRGWAHIKKHLGINVSPHLFRHFVGKIVMERDPGMIADISRRLGHKSINTTYGTYLGTETPAASRRINALLEGLQGEPE